MPAAAEPRRAERGQVLPLGLAALLVCAALFALSLRLGARLLQRERVRMRADVTAISGGVQYARALNTLALSQQALGVSWLAAIVTLGEAGGAVAAVQKLQKAFLTFAPWAAEASVLYLGYENGLLALPLWNRRSLLEDLSPAALKPAFNVHVYGLAEGLADALSQLFGLGQGGLGTEEVRKLMEGAERDLGEGGRAQVASLARRWAPGLDLDRLTTIKGYQYRRRSDGQLVDLPADAAGAVRERGPGGERLVYKEKTAAGPGRYVSPRRGLDMDLPLGLADDGEHWLTLLACQAPDPAAKWERPGWALALSQVQVDGGSMVMGDLLAAGYGPRFVPLQLLPGGGGGTRDLELGAQHGFASDLKGLHLRLRDPAAPERAAAGGEKELAAAAGAGLDLLQALLGDGQSLRAARRWVDLGSEALAVRH